MSFQTLGLVDSLLDAIKTTGYTTPTSIQAQAIPAILSGQDVMAAAQTGTGKTAGFTLPLLQSLNTDIKVKSRHVRALVLTPTRELAAQVSASIETYGKNEGLHTVVVFGGVKINPQRQKLAKGADILVATPGRLLDLYQQKAMDFSSLEVLVLDEADRMLDMGFIRDIRRILPLLPKERQNLMFSATFSDDIRQLARSICSSPVEIDVAPRNSTVESINQCIYQLPKEDKYYLLRHLVSESADQVLLFSRTKHGANKLVKRLEKDGIRAAAIHGNKSQAQRTKALNDFKKDKVQVLVATDIAARGIDIQALSLVVNFDLPNVEEDYVHRIGRTGRAGASGRAISLVGPDEKKLLRDIERFIKRKIDREEVPQFERGDVEVARVQQHEKRTERRADEATEGRPRRDRKGGNGGNRKRRPGADSGKQSAGQRGQQQRNAGDREESRQDGNRKPRRQQRSRQRTDDASQPGQQKARGQRNQEQGNQERRHARKDEQGGNGSAGSNGASKRGNGRRRQSEAQSSGSPVSRIRRFFGGNGNKSSARAD